MKKIAVFGHAGFSGRYFVEYIVSQGIQVFGFDSKLLSQENKITECCGNAKNINEVDNFLKDTDFDFIINLIGDFSGISFQELVEANAIITNNILETVLKRQTKVNKILIIGSAAEYGNAVENPVKEECVLKPVNSYGLSKVFQTAVGEYYNRIYNLPVVTARTFNIYGKGLSAMLSLGNFAKQIDKAQDGDIIYVGNISAKRDFLPVDEVVRQYWNLLLYGVPGKVYNVCSGKPISIHEMLLSMIQQSNKNLQIKVDKDRFKENDIDVIYGDPTKYKELIRKIIF